jgi:hypothetical protein
MMRLLRSCLLVGLVLVAPSNAHAVSFDDQSATTGLVELFENTVTPVWIDADLDGSPEPLWVSYEGWFGLDIDEDGGAELKALATPSGFVNSEGPNIISVVLDTDGDGTPELLVITQEIDIYRLVAPWKFKRVTKRAISLPPATVVDAAVGDLNGDGLPDIVAGMGLYRTEYLPWSGHRDVALMNLGYGRFEAVAIEPSNAGLSNGITLADIDGDGRLDLIESLDFTTMGEKSRIFLNRTEPGAPTLSWVVAEHTYDSGTYGMGAAVADINGDGLPDIYNSSLGRDLLVLGQPDGSWLDVTFEVGVLHEWGASGIRNQWAPMFLDLNADGRLDIFVRQGGMGTESFMGTGAGPLLAVAERDVLYLGGEDGRFHRALPPHHPKVATMGRTAAAGDGNNDGLPDMALGGVGGSSGYWRNDTLLGESARPLTVRFESSLSGWPPTGARVEGTCGGKTVRRTLTSGGLVGSTGATEVYLGWSACDGPTTVSVHWPSGVISTQSVESSERVTTAIEPRWWSLDPDALGTVTLDPGAAGVDQACVGSSQGQWTCCPVEDAPCTVGPPESVGGGPLAKLPGELAVALPMGAPRWTMVTSPSPPRPGEMAEVYVMLQGDPRAFESLTSGPSAPTLMQGPDSLAWSAIDESSWTLRTFVDVPLDATSLELTLFPFDLPTSPTWVLSTASSIDPVWSTQNVFPYRITGGVTEFWHLSFYTTLIRGVPPAQALVGLELATPEGVSLAITASHDAMALSRARILLDPALVLNAESVVLRDKGGSFEQTYEIFPELSLEEALPLVDSAIGGVRNMRMVGGGEDTDFLFSLLDASGRVLPPEPELIKVEVEGAELIIEPATQMAFVMAGFIRTLPGIGPGEVRILSADGRLLGTFPFDRRAPGNSGVSQADSSVEAFVLEENEAPTGPGEPTHRVRVHARNAVGDVLGLSAQMDPSVTGAEKSSDVIMGPGGGMLFLVTVPATPGEMVVEISLEGVALEPLVVAHDGHPYGLEDPPDTTIAEEEADIAEEPNGAIVDAVPTASKGGGGGCAAGGASPWSVLFWFVPLLLLGLRCGRSWGVLGLLLGVATLVMGAAPAPVQMVSHAEELGLLDLSDEHVVPFWIDIDLDGSPEAVYLDIGGATAVDIDDSGSLVTVAVEISASVLENAGRPELVIAVADVDRDGSEEVVVIANTVTVLKVTSPFVLSAEPILSPSLPGASALDIAVGDLNADGWPDFVIGFGVYTPDRLELRGISDVVLMNLGHGCFESYILEPAREGLSNGITLVDMNGDGLPDVVESVDASPLVGISRILINKTKPGDRVPKFEVHPHSYDTGSYGMGAAVDDLDQDGYLDIYNTSVGPDLLAAGRADGAFDQVARSRGILHEWGVGKGQRMQWSPSFSDLNADGRLDIIVRQGAMGQEVGQGSGPWLAGVAPDLLYLQDETGKFIRVEIPFDDQLASQGRQAVLGDLDGDGLRDVALGGQAGHADFWMNETLVPATTRRLLVRFAPTVSAHPPVGARLEATCAGVTRTRVLTSGGKMGGSAVAERSFAWPQCAEAPTVQVRWPSGALSTHVAQSDQVLLIAQEPVWVTEGASGDTSVVLDPTGTSSEKACLLQITGSQQCCALADAPCEFSVEQGDAGSPRVFLGEQRAMALAAEEERWALSTDPAVPEPGGTVMLQIAHGGRASRFDPESVTLIVGTKPVAWALVDEERGLLRATATLPEGLGEVPLKLFPQDLLEPTWILRTGTALDSRWLLVDPYPYRVLGGVTELWYWSVYLNGVRDRPSNLSVKSLSFSTLDGQAIEGQWTHISMGRTRMRGLISWDVLEGLEGLDALEIHDGAGAVTLEIPVPPPRSLEEATLTVVGTFGGVVKNRLVENGDLSNIFITFIDSEGIVLPPEPEFVVLEFDGAELVDPLAPAGGSYDLAATMRTLPGAGPGEVRARTTDGRVVGAWPFERRLRVPAGVDIERSWTAFTEPSPLDPPEATHRLEIHALNSFDEVMGANLVVELDLENITLIAPPLFEGTGIYTALVAPSPGATFMAATPILDGVAGTRIEIVAPPTDPPEVADHDPDAGVTDPDATTSVDIGPLGPVESDPPEPSKGGGGGCGAGPGQSSPAWCLVLLFAILALRRRGGAEFARWVGTLTVLLLVARPILAAPAPVAFDALGAELGLVGGTHEPLIVAWIDVDLDGASEPLWLTYAGVHTLGEDADGQLSLIEVSAPALMDDKGGPRMSTAVLDVDQDGQDELLVITQELLLFEVTAPYVLEAVSYPLPVLPAVQSLDVSVGDLNADGLVDVVLALGIFATERVERRGYTDLLMMNLGAGRFELVPLEPARECYTHGLTLADMNQDGRLDIVESCDASYFVGPSRVLLNETNPGSFSPVFAVTEATYDTGTFGMGAAVADFDGDGLLDIYNTNIGNDLLVRSTAEGGFQDVTFELGIDHEWGYISGARTQWSPTWHDLNLDGRLDLMVRQGSFGVVTPLPVGPGLASSASDLVYLNDGEGRFVRVPVPFDPEAPPEGRQAVLGDADGDGRFDVALGGLAGAGGYWRNVTPVPMSGRALSVSLRGTVSGSPPTGAQVTGQCGDEVLTRHLTSGGHMGATAAPQVGLAWSACDAPVTLHVRWPSGALSEVEVAPGETSLALTEPTWLYPDPTTPGTTLLDPSGVSEPICYGTESTPWVCCETEDAPCVLPRAKELGEALYVQVGSRPLRLVETPETRWSLETSPSPLIPGEPGTLRISHLGPVESFDPSSVTLFVDGAPTTLTESDASRRVLHYALDVPLSPTLEVAVFPPDLPTAPTWVLHTGRAADPRWTRIDTYPHRILGGFTEFWEWAAFVVLPRDRPLSWAQHLRLEDGQGVELEHTLTDMSVSVGRVRLLVPWESLEGLESLTLRDGEGGATWELPVPEARSLEEVVTLIDRVEGGLAKNRLLEDGDMIPLFLVLLDGQDRVLSPEPELIRIEADGAVVSQEPDMIPGAYNLYAMLTTTPGVGPGEVRVLTVDDRLLGTFPFERRARGAVAVSEEHSWATLTALDDEGLPATLHELRIAPMNSFGESLGISTVLTLDISGGAQEGGLEFDASGTLRGRLRSDGSETHLTVAVGLSGVELPLLSVEVPYDAHVPTTDVQVGTDAVDSSPEGGDDLDSSPEGGDDLGEAAPSSGSRSSGCSGAADASLSASALLLALMVLLLRLARRRRSRASLPCG